MFRDQYIRSIRISESESNLFTLKDNPNQQILLLTVMEKHLKNCISISSQLNDLYPDFYFINPLFQI